MWSSLQHFMSKSTPWECCARSAKFWMLANTQTRLLAPFDKFLVPYLGFFLSFYAFGMWHI